jgi:major membrane immunogen (membrane-anchored lipoprotein)
VAHFFDKRSGFFTNKTKSDIMKKLLGITALSVWLVACGDTQSDNKSIGSPNSATEAQETTPNAYTPENGDVTFREGKVLVMKNGEWEKADGEVKLDNGAVVYADGRVVRDDKEITLQDGEVVNESGDVFDRTGKAIESAWQDAKKDVKDAGKEIEKGAKKTGDKVEDAVDHDDHK